MSCFDAISAHTWTGHCDCGDKWYSLVCYNLTSRIIPSLLCNINRRTDRQFISSELSLTKSQISAQQNVLHFFQIFYITGLRSSLLHVLISYGIIISDLCQSNTSMFQFCEMLLQYESLVMIP